MQRLEVSGAVRPLYGSLGVKRLMWHIEYRIIFRLIFYWDMAMTESIL